MKKSIVEQVRGRPKYLHNALNFQSNFPNSIGLRAIFSQSQGPPAPGSERQENPWICRVVSHVCIIIIYIIMLDVVL